VWEVNPSISILVFASQHVAYPPPRKKGMEGRFPPSCFSLGVCMVTQRLSVSPRQEIGTTLGEDKLFDLNGIEDEQKSEAIG